MAEKLINKLSSESKFIVFEMDDKVNAESGFQLVSRFNGKPSLLHLDDILFPDGPNPGDIIQISGESGVGKSMLLMKFLTKSLLPKMYCGIQIGGLEGGVILIDTDNGVSILKLVYLMEKFILRALQSHPDTGTALKNLLCRDKLFMTTFLKGSSFNFCFTQ